MEFICPKCGVSLEAPEELHGTKCECPQCKTMISIQRKPAATCPECGKEIKENAVICINCGMNLKTGKQMTTDKSGEVSSSECLYQCSHCNKIVTGIEEEIFETSGAVCPECKVSTIGFEFEIAKIIPFFEGMSLDELKKAEDETSAQLYTLQKPWKKEKAKLQRTFFLTFIFWFVLLIVLFAFGTNGEGVLHSIAVVIGWLGISGLILSLFTIGRRFNVEANELKSAEMLELEAKLTAIQKKIVSLDKISKSKQAIIAIIVLLLTGTILYIAFKLLSSVSAH